MKSLKFITLVYILIATFSSRIHSQSLYNDFQESKKKKIFFDDFNSNTNNWLLLDNENELISIENGTYIYESRDGQAKANYLPIKINQKKNFEIELKIKFSQGEDNNSNGLAFGGSTNFMDRILFAFSGDGNYCIAQFSPLKFLIPWTSSTEIHRTDYNLLTVRKVGKKYYFFINQILVETLQFQPFYGDKIGIHCNSNTKIHVDFLKVNYLKKKCW